jgi:hypothetical protein
LCSACPHDYPQFKKNGILAWFPDLGIIRVVGGDCYKTLNPSGYELAERRYRSSREQRQEERYLLRRAWQIPLILSDSQDDRKILASVDDVRAAVVRALHHYEIDLHRHIADGELHVDKPQWDKKSKFGRTVMVPQVYARIKGSSFVDPTMTRFSRGLDKIVRSLSKCDFGADWEEKIASLSPKRQKAAAEAIAEGLDSLRSLRSQFEDVRAFLSVPTLATLRTWSDHSTSQCRFYFDYSDTELRIGRSMARYQRIAMPTQCYEALAALPSFSGKDT